MRETITQCIILLCYDPARRGLAASFPLWIDAKDRNT
jgi:hypothetical protein